MDPESDFQGPEPAPQENNLAARAAKGDVPAFEALISLEPVRKAILTIYKRTRCYDVRNLVTEVQFFGEVVAHLWGKLLGGRYDPEMDFLPWLRRVTNNLATDRGKKELREKNKRKRAEEQRRQVGLGGPSFPAERSSSDRAASVYRIVESSFFSELEKKIFLLRFREGWRQKDIAEEVNLSEPQVSKVIKRMILKLKAITLKLRPVDEAPEGDFADHRPDGETPEERTLNRCEGQFDGLKRLIFRLWFRRKMTEAQIADHEDVRLPIEKVSSLLTELKTELEMRNPEDAREILQRSEGGISLKTDVSAEGRP